MKPILLEPTDVLFFRDAVPMSAGQGAGAGCRLPFPTTLHEALRSSLLLANGKLPHGKEIPGRPRGAARKGNWHAESFDTDIHVASKAYRSLQTAGPFPWTARTGILFPVPLDVAWGEHSRPGSPEAPPPALRPLQLLPSGNSISSAAVANPADFAPPCLPAATTPPDKRGQLHGWWTATQFADYLTGGTANSDDRFRPVATLDLWQPEHRIGVQINPATFSAAERQLYAGSYLRAEASTRFALLAGLADPRNGEQSELEALDWLLLGGDQRLARVWREQGVFANLPKAPSAPASEGPCLLKWVLVTPAILAHGSLPGWCWNASDGKPAGRVRLGPSARKAGRKSLPGQAQLICWCVGKPLTVSGWDFVEQRAKPTRLAVPAGSVFYFLCENALAAEALGQRLHWQPRSDYFGEKGCGYGFVSFDVQLHRTSPDVRALANQLFK
jgi:CRISPR-associated protein Cmr3